MTQKFYQCKRCGNLIGKIVDTGAPLVCCGEAMEELLPNTVDAAVEKHLPAVTLEQGILNVKVGSVDHPMEEAHHISFVYVQTKNGGQRKNLEVGSKPELNFGIVDDEVVAVFAYCNLHGLWKSEL